MGGWEIPSLGTGWCHRPGGIERGVGLLLHHRVRLEQRVGVIVWVVSAWCCEDCLTAATYSSCHKWWLFYGKNTLQIDMEVLLIRSKFIAF